MGDQDTGMQAVDTAMVHVAGVKMISVDDIEANEWNPNDMTEKEMNRLGEEIRNVGFVDPIQVVPLKTGKYRIIGGEHRWRAGKALGMEAIPCVLLTEAKWGDEDLQKFVTVRLNVIKGKLDPEKMLGLYDELAKKYGEESMQELMGFSNDTEWKKLIGGVNDALAAADLPKDLLQKFGDMQKEVKTIDGLSVILNKLFSEYGDTLNSNFMVFSYGTKEHIYVICDKQTFDAADKITGRAQAGKFDVNEIFHRVFTKWEEKVVDLPIEPPTPTTPQPPVAQEPS